MARRRRLRPGDLGRQGYTGEPLGFGPQPGGGGSVAGPARRPDGGGGADKTEAAAAYQADPALASMRIDFTATVREVLEVLIAGFLARH